MGECEVASNNKYSHAKMNFKKILVFTRICLYTTIEEFGVGKIFRVFERSVFWSPRLDLFDQEYSKKCTF